MKRLLALILALVMLVSLISGCSSSSTTNDTNTTNTTSTDSEYERLKLNLNISGTEQGIDAIAANYFADAVKEASNGNIEITVYPNSQLAGGNMAKSIELLTQGGSYELAILSGAVLAGIDGKFLTHSLPFIFDSYDAAKEYLDGTGGEYYNKLLDDVGIVGMGVFHNGLKQFTHGKKPIKTPEDLKNMKIRVPGGEVAIKTFQTLGADPISMTWGEVYTALQQGTIDGHENSYQTIWSASIQEVQPYITEINWQYEGYWFLANKNNWNTFSEATQKLLMEKSIEAAEYARNYQEEQEKDIKKQFIEEGITITELTPEERQAFIDSTEEVRQYFIEKFGEEACTAWGVVK